MTKGSTRVPPIITPVWVCGRAGWFQAMFGQNGGVSFINRRSALIGSVTGGASEGCRRLAKDDEQAKPENGQKCPPTPGPIAGACGVATAQTPCERTWTPLPRRPAGSRARCRVSLLTP